MTICIYRLLVRRKKREEEKAQAQEALNTFAKVAQDWHRNISQNRWSETHAGRVWRDVISLSF